MSRNLRDFFLLTGWILIIWGLMCFSTGCANMPSRYGEHVRITGGVYSGLTGRLISDCSGFENYKVLLTQDNHSVCVRSWNLERY